MEQLLWLFPLGFAVGTIGTLIGAGGGFMLVPILLLIYPNKSPEVITSSSLAVVFFNALSGSFAYLKMKRIEFKSGLIFAFAAIPGSILGALTTPYITRALFNFIFGIILLVVAFYLFFYQRSDTHSRNNSSMFNLFCSITDYKGHRYLFSYNLATGIILSVLIGYFSSLLGIGGGILHVPVMSQILNFPVHIATATSHFVLTLISFTGSMTYFMQGSLENSYLQITSLSLGAVIGAQLGAKLSNRFHGRLIIRCLAGGLVIVGLRILFM